MSDDYRAAAKRYELELRAAEKAAAVFHVECLHIIGFGYWHGIRIAASKAGCHPSTIRRWRLIAHRYDCETWVQAFLPMQGAAS